MTRRACLVFVLVAAALINAAAGATTFEKIRTDVYRFVPEGAASVVKCFLLYSRNDIINAKVDAAMEVVLESTESSAKVSFFNHADYSFGHVDENGVQYLLCDGVLLAAGYCGNAKVGEPILIEKKANSTSLSSYTLSVSDSITDSYIIPTAGEYCVLLSVISGTPTMTLYMEFPYGKLPANEYPFLPFYGILGLFYLVAGLVWTGFCIYYWQVLLQVQHYISGVIFLCIMEHALRYAYYANYNTYGLLSMPLLTVAIILSAGRAAAALSALLVVCLGYGLLRPTLGEDGKKVFFLGLCHFVFVALFDASVHVESPSASMFGVVTLLLTAITFAIYIVAIMSGLGETLAKLMVRQQMEKIQTYIYLKRIILTAVTIFAFIFLGIIVFQTGDQTDNWQVAWFITEGSLGILYFFIVISVMVLWRPTANNQRYGLAFNESEIQMDDHVISLSAVNEKVKLRRQNNGRDGMTEEDENLKWVEENVPVLEQIEDIQVMTQDEQDSARMLLHERSKLN